MVVIIWNIVELIHRYSEISSRGEDSKFFYLKPLVSKQHRSQQVEGPFVSAGKVVGRWASFKTKIEQGSTALPHTGEKSLDSHMKTKGRIERAEEAGREVKE